MSFGAKRFANALACLAEIKVQMLMHCGGGIERSSGRGRGSTLLARGAHVESTNGTCIATINQTKARRKRPSADSQWRTALVWGGRCAEHMSHIHPPLYDGGCPSMRARRCPWGQRREGGGGPAGFCSQGGNRESIPKTSNSIASLCAFQ